jgi:hypothetical protein
LLISQSDSKLNNIQTLYEQYSNDLRDFDEFSFDLLQLVAKAGRKTSFKVVFTHIFLIYDLFEVIEIEKFETFIDKVFDDY